jgi:hypothetical protein
VHERRPAIVEHGDALLDALQGPHEVVLETDQDPDRVLVGAAPDLVGIGVGLGDDPPALVFGRLGQAAFADEERRLLLGPGDDPLRLLVRALQDPLALLVDPLRLADLLGDRDPELVDEAQSRVLVDDDVVREGQLLAVRDQRLEPLDQEDDVDVRTPPRCADRSIIALRGRPAPPPLPDPGASPSRRRRTGRSP